MSNPIQPATAPLEIRDIRERANTFAGVRPLDRYEQLFVDLCDVLLMQKASAGKDNPVPSSWSPEALAAADAVATAHPGLATARATTERVDFKDGACQNCGEKWSAPAGSACLNDELHASVPPSAPALSPEEGRVDDDYDAALDALAEAFSDFVPLSAQFRLAGPIAKARQRLRELYDAALPGAGDGPKQCKWTEVDRGVYDSACGWHSLHVASDEDVSSFCANCGGEVVVDSLHSLPSVSGDAERTAALREQARAWGAVVDALNVDGAIVRRMKNHSGDANKKVTGLDAVLAEIVRLQSAGDASVERETVEGQVVRNRLGRNSDIRNYCDITVRADWPEGTAVTVSRTPLPPAVSTPQQEPKK